MPMPWHGARIFFLLTVVAIGGVQVHAAWQGEVRRFVRPGLQDPLLSLHFPQGVE